MIESFIMASLAFLAKIFYDRETIMYNSRWEYFIFWLGCFFIAYSGFICSDFIRSVMK